MLVKNVEKYINILENLPENNLKTSEGNEITEAGELHRVYFGDVSELSENEKEHRQITEENNKQRRNFLLDLATEEFYLLYNAFDLGLTYFTNKDELENEINHFGGEEELIKENLKHIKSRFSKHTGIEQLTGKQDRLVIGSLKGYIEKFL